MRGKIQLHCVIALIITLHLGPREIDFLLTLSPILYCRLILDSLPVLGEECCNRVGEYFPLIVDIFENIFRPLHHVTDLVTWR